ncbi:vacuolar sorting-associated protein 32-like 2 [Trifolium pratense]|uniref:Vacuolar sorting-associated protein 32-like 2 n=1 Tax=Trifolium pratense TaxID=57577 RepID=A0A2K3MX95_TRIPR|nr:vacuolar sorting-associated protein 32-like 2 [Trifolium pratense]
MSNGKENCIALPMVWNERSVRVYFQFNDSEKVMYGNEDGVEELEAVEELEDGGENKAQHVGQDEPVADHVHVGQEPIEWNKTVSKSMANLSKKQVLDELEGELEELEGAELEEQLVQPATTAPAAVHTPSGRQPTRPLSVKPTSEEDELAALQPEMAL